MMIAKHACGAYVIYRELEGENLREAMSDVGHHSRIEIVAVGRLVEGWVESAPDGEDLLEDDFCPICGETLAWETLTQMSEGC